MGAMVERKFLVRELPSKLREGNFSWIHEIYLDGRKLTRTIRDNNTEEYKECLQNGNGLPAKAARIREIDFWKAWYANTGRKVELSSHSVNYNGCSKMTINIFRGKLASHVIILDVQFKNFDRAKAFVPPAWCTEITGNDNYSNYSLATKGLRLLRRAAA